MTVADPYWSRRGSDWQLAKREDPVRWGRLSGPLSAAELESFVSRGYLVRESLFGTEAIAQLLEQAHRLADALDPGTRDDIICEPDNNAIRSIFRVHHKDDLFAALADDERLVATARQILGSEVYIHQSRINFKPGFDGRAFNWHSDFETWHIEDGMPRMRALSASLLLTDNTAVNGPLMLVPGSHRTYVRCVGATPADHYKESLKVQNFGVPEPEALRRLVADGGITQAVAPAGSVVFFDCNIMHGSAGNMTPYPRHNVFFVFNSVANRLVEPFGGTPPRPLFLAERQDAAPGHTR